MALALTVRCLLCPARTANLLSKILAGVLGAMLFLGGVLASLGMNG